MVVDMVPLCQAPDAPLDFITSNDIDQPFLVLLVVKLFGNGGEVEAKLVVDEQANLGVVVVAAQGFKVGLCLGSITDEVDVCWTRKRYHYNVKLNSFGRHTNCSVASLKVR